MGPVDSKSGRLKKEGGIYSLCLGDRFFSLNIWKKEEGSKIYIPPPPTHPPTHTHTHPGGGGGGGYSNKQSYIFINFYTHMAAHSSPLPTNKSSHKNCVLVPNFRYSSYGKQVYLKVLKSRPNTSFEHQENAFLP